MRYSKTVIISHLLLLLLLFSGGSKGGGRGVNLPRGPESNFFFHVHYERFLPNLDGLWWVAPLKCGDKVYASVLSFLQHAPRPPGLYPSLPCQARSHGRGGSNTDTPRRLKVHILRLKRYISSESGPIECR